MKSGMDCWDHVFDREGKLFPQVTALYRSVLGHDIERRRDLRETLGVSRQHFAKHLQQPPDRANKTRLRLCLHLLANEARDRGVGAVILPLGDYNVTVRSGSAVVLTADTPPVGWETAQPVLDSYASALSALIEDGSHDLTRLGTPSHETHLWVVGGVALVFMVTALRTRLSSAGHVVCLPEARPYAPLQINRTFLSPLDRYFHQRAGKTCVGPATQDLVWNATLHDQSRAKQLQRWRLGMIGSKGSEIPSDFICSPSYRFPCTRSATDERVKFESMKAVHGLWRYLRGHKLPMPISTDFLNDLLHIDVG
jgi:hypothetical protein